MLDLHFRTPNWGPGNSQKPNDGTHYSVSASTDTLDQKLPVGPALLYFISYQCMAK